MPATCPMYLNCLYLITLIISGEEKNDQVPQYSVLSTPLLLPPS